MRKLNIWIFTMLACDRETPEAPNIDLATESVTFELVSQNDKFTGTVAMKGVIKNVDDKFRSGQGQQIAALYGKLLS